jgi:two-component system KDP operon response regulator KdpE
LKKLREWYSKPVIILSVRQSEDDIVTALDYGANDYLSKPFRSAELLARIRAALRASDNKKEAEILNFGTLCIDFLTMPFVKMMKY